MSDRGPLVCPRCVAFVDKDPTGVGSWRCPGCGGCERLVGFQDGTNDEKTKLEVIPQRPGVKRS